jgi:hypothetical protein
VTIIVMRGTSGSGKTYVAQQVIAALRARDGEPEVLPLGAKAKVGGYRWPRVTVVGRYETACGGCDSMSWKGAADDIEALVVAEVGAGRHVLLEGLMVATWGWERLLRMGAVAPLQVVHLTTPLEDCLTAVGDRRAARAEAKGVETTPLNPKNTTDKYYGLLTHTRNQRKKGVPIAELDRAAALNYVLGALEL